MHSNINFTCGAPHECLHIQPEWCTHSVHGSNLIAVYSSSVELLGTHATCWMQNWACKQSVKQVHALRWAGSECVHGVAAAVAVAVPDVSPQAAAVAAAAVTEGPARRPAVTAATAGPAAASRPVQRQQQPVLSQQLGLGSAPEIYWRVDQSLLRMIWTWLRATAGASRRDLVSGLP